MINNETMQLKNTVLRFETPDDSNLRTRFGNPDSGKPLFESVGNPLASCLRDQISARQIQIARDLARRASLDENDVCWGLFGCDFSELSRFAAESLIAYLRISGLNTRSRVRMAG